MLEELLALEVYSFMIVFTRFGTAFAFLPGFSTYLTMRQRLSLALAICILVEPLVRDSLPVKTDNAVELSLLIITEATIGLFLAFYPRILVSALSLAGNKMSMAIGLANARAFDPVAGAQSEVLTAFISLVAIILIFATNLHHLMLVAVINSYSLFIPGKPLMMGDFSSVLIDVLNKSFHIGFQLAAPFVVFAIVFHTGMGLVSRLMPQLNIFFIALPIKLYCGFSLLIITVSTIMMWFMKYFEESMYQFLSHG
ncbi:MAG: flagellar biosynthetic protein FliR [Alphaproteobacteria bacterium]|nr:flagellar biosynthetic protein FliR [Alphaproteobacteria bacterium]